MIEEDLMVIFHPALFLIQILKFTRPFIKSFFLVSQAMINLSRDSFLFFQFSTIFFKSVAYFQVLPKPLFDT